MLARKPGGPPWLYCSAEVSGRPCVELDAIGGGCREMEWYNAGTCAGLHPWMQENINIFSLLVPQKVKKY